MCGRTVLRALESACIKLVGLPCACILVDPEYTTMKCICTYVHVDPEYASLPRTYVDILYVCVLLTHMRCGLTTWRSVSNRSVFLLFCIIVAVSDDMEVCFEQECIFIDTPGILAGEKQISGRGTRQAGSCAKQ